MRSRIGPVVEGADFWPRSRIVDELYSSLVEGRGGRRMFGLRRIGKTSILRELARKLRAHGGLTVISITAEKSNRVGDFLSDVFRQIPSDSRHKTVRQRIGGNPFFKWLLPSLAARLGGAAAPANILAPGFVNELQHHAAWEGDLDAALREMGSVVMLIDELPFMLRNMRERGGYSVADIESFLALLKGWRNDCGVRMILTGSLGLWQLHRTHGVRFSDQVGDLLPIFVPPLEREDAVAMVEALALGERVADWSRELSVAVVDGSAETWPIFLQAGFDEIRRAGVRDPAQVSATIEERVRPKLDESFYAQFQTRLSRYEKDERPARAILKCIASGAPVAFEIVDKTLKDIGALEKRDDLFEALREDDFILFDTEAQTARSASKLVPIWVRSRAWGR